MAPIAEQIAELVDMLPESDQQLAFALIQKMVLAWDSDFTKLTHGEKAALTRAEAEMSAGEYIPESAINWN